MGDERKRMSPLATLQSYFDNHRAQISAALPKHLNPDRMARLAMTEFSQNGTLARCDPRTIFASVVVASQLGLEIGVTGQGYLVPYKGKATFVPGWQGLVDLVSRAGRGSVWTGAVFEGDEFEFQLGDSPKVLHRPCGEDNPKLMTHTYAIGRVRASEFPIIEVWPIRRIWAHRDKYNKVGADHYSFKYPEMYARKIPLLQVLKYMPKSTELTAAIELSNRVDEGRAASIDANFMIITEDDEDGAQAEDRTPMRDRVRRRSDSAPTQPDPPPQAEPPGGKQSFDTIIAGVRAAKDVEELDYWRSVANDSDITENELKVVKTEIEALTQKMQEDR